jgi:hypothetical protein
MLQLGLAVLSVLLNQLLQCFQLLQFHQFVQ